MSIEAGDYQVPSDGDEEADSYSWLPATPEEAEFSLQDRVLADRADGEDDEEWMAMATTMAKDPAALQCYLDVLAEAADKARAAHSD